MDLSGGNAGKERGVSRDPCGAARSARNRCLFASLDERGNSVRGVKFCREISTLFDLHMFNAPQISTTVLRKRTFIGEVFSNRLRSEGDRNLLERFGKGVEVLLIQGAVSLAPTEVVIGEVIKRDNNLHGVINRFRSSFHQGDAIVRTGDTPTRCTYSFPGP
jgi:hypothetical protein